MPRERLANRRPHETVSFRHGKFHYTAGVGRFEDGRPAEVFLSCGKAGTEVAAAARDAAIVISIALQFGAPAETIRRALTREEDGTAAGPVAALLDILAADPPAPAPDRPPEPDPAAPAAEASGSAEGAAEDKPSELIGGNS